MSKKMMALVLTVYLTATSGVVYANTGDTVTADQATSVEATSTTTQDGEALGENPEAVATLVDEEDIKDSAGILPTSIFYSIERGIEQLQIAITESEEKLAALKAQFATERAAEAVIMENEDEEELANDAMSEYVNMLASATQHINKAIEAQVEAVKTLETLNESYKQSEEILNTILANAPDEAKELIESVLNEQDKALVAVNDFYAAKAAFFAAKNELEEAKKELKAAKKSGDAEAIRIAEEKVKAAEALKDQLEDLKDEAETAKEEVKNLVKQAEKRIELGLKHIEKANEKMEKVQEKAFEAEKKVEEKTKKAEEKAREIVKKAEEKSRESLKEAEEKAREEAKKAIKSSYNYDNDDDEHDED